MDDTTTGPHTVAQALREYGQALRQDWSDFDGRGARTILGGLADELDHPTGATLRQLREQAGVCLAGGGHWCGSWHGYCNARCGCECSRDEQD